MALHTSEHSRADRPAVSLGWIGVGIVALALIGGVAVAGTRSAADRRRRASRRGWDHGKGIDLKAAITVNRPIQDVYRFWRQFETFPGFMRNVEHVERIDERRSRWTFSGPAGVKIDWEAEIITDQPDHMISWRSIPGASVDHRGAVRFEHAPGGRGTEVHVEMTYHPPAGQLGRAAAWLFGKDPRGDVREDLRRVKQMLEIGEVPLSDGAGLSAPAQPHASADAAKDLAGVRS